jgi:subtilisin family serine protease
MLAGALVLVITFLAPVGMVPTAAAQPGGESHAQGFTSGLPVPPVAAHGSVVPPSSGALPSRPRSSDDGGRVPSPNPSQGPSRGAADRASADPFATFDEELAAAGRDYDGFIVVLAEPTLLDQIRSLLTRGRPVDVIARGAERVVNAGGEVTADLEGLLTAVVADLTPEEARALIADPAVRWVSPNALVSLDARRVAVTSSHTFNDFFLWGPAVLDSRSSDWLALGGISYATYVGVRDRTYRYSSDGAGVDVFVVDSGVKASHPDLSGRVVAATEYPAIAGSSFPAGYFRADTLSGPDPVLGDDDCNGHGTHVAATIAGSYLGVARSARIVPVKVFPSCSRSAPFSTIIAGLDWIREKITAAPDRPYVVNMSLGGPATSVLDAAVEALIDLPVDGGVGVTVVVAAGNDNISASLVSPARVADAITVGALGNAECANIDCTAIFLYHNERAGYSNHGSAVDIMAPGSVTFSACVTPNAQGVDEGGNPATSACQTVTVDGVAIPVTPLNGTSMAAPHVAGLAARIVGDRFAADGTILTPAQVWATIQSSALTGVLDETYVSLVGSPNLTLNSLGIEPLPTDLQLPAVIACFGSSGPSSQLISGGVAPLSWSVTAGELPSTLAMSSVGRLTGSAGLSSGSVTLQVTDVFGRSVSRSFLTTSLPLGCP